MKTMCSISQSRDMAIQNEQIEINACKLLFIIATEMKK